MRKRSKKILTVLILLTFLLSAFSTALTVVARADDTNPETQDMSTEEESQEAEEVQDQPDEGTLTEAEDKAEEESNIEVTGNEDEESNSETEEDAVRISQRFGIA